jgi:hypothetical protein
MARAAARSGPSTRMLECGRKEFEFGVFADSFFFIGRRVLRNPGVGASWGNDEPEKLQINQDSSRTNVSFVESNRNQSAIDRVCPGKINSGAISLSGCNTNRRKWARGCGNVNAGVIRIS